MDFEPTQEMQDAAALARDILTDRCTPERLKAVEATGTRFDHGLWQQLGSAGLVGLPLPEEYGGAGLTELELLSVLEEAGRVLAPVPLAAHVPTAMTLARFGTAEQKLPWLTRAATAEVVLTSAVAEDRADVPAVPSTTARHDGTDWVLTGTKTTVPAGTVADLFLVPADTADGVVVFIVEPADDGVTVSAQTTPDGDSAARLDLDGVVLGAHRVLAGDDVPAYLTQRLTLGVCAWQLGVCDGALAITSSYATTREQFGRPIGTFQAVSQRLADGYIDVLGLRLTTTNAAWRLAEGLPADVEVATAKLWAADTGHKVAHTTVHVHGGVGIDLDGEAHRYFTAAKRTEFALGGSTLQARDIGRVLAGEPA